MKKSSFCKKSLIFVLAIVLVFSIFTLAACNGKENQTSVNNVKELIEKHPDIAKTFFKNEVIAAALQSSVENFDTSKILGATVDLGDETSKNLQSVKIMLLYENTPSEYVYSIYNVDFKTSIALQNIANYNPQNTTSNTIKDATVNKLYDLVIPASDYATYPDTLKNAIYENVIKSDEKAPQLILKNNGTIIDNFEGGMILYTYTDFELIAHTNKSVISYKIYIKAENSSANLIESLSNPKNYKLYKTTVVTDLITPFVVSEYKKLNDKDPLIEYAPAPDENGYIVTNANKEYFGSIVIPPSYNGLPVVGIANSAFENCSEVTSIELPFTISKIDSSAFKDCISLNNITIPSKMTTIENSAFENCTALTNITIPDNVTSIQDAAFKGCKNLNNITINSNVNIAENAFSNCKIKNVYYTNTIEKWLEMPYPTLLSNGANLYINDNLLTDLVIPDSVTEIKDSAFRNCHSLTSVTLSNNTTIIGKDAFYGCKSLKDVFYNGGIANWCNISFASGSANPLQNNAKLYIDNQLITKLVIPNSVTKIKEYLFSDYSLLESVTIPNSVTSIDYHAFYSCDSLASVTISDGITTMSAYAFEYCNLLKDVYYTGTIETWCNLPYTQILNNKMNLYINGDLLTDIEIPSSVTELKNYTFYNCGSITSVTIPNSVKKIGTNVFQYCTSLQNVKIGNGVSTIETRAFSDCKSLTTITFGDKLTKINDYAFYNCVQLENINFSNIHFIGKEAFDNCISLKKAHFGENLQKIDDYAFSHCHSLYDITINCGNIDTHAFASCYSLTSITIGSKVACASDAFLGCTNLLEVYNLSEYKLEFDGYYTNPKVYTSKDEPSQLTTTSDGFVFYDDGTKVLLVRYVGTETDIVLPNDFNGKNYAIKNYAFYECHTLTSISIPDCVTCIEEYTFYNCRSLTSITIGNKIKRIEDYAFYGCKSLKEVFYKGTSNEWNSIFISWEENDYLENATRYYYSETKPTTSGNYWHYAEDGKTIVKW